MSESEPMSEGTKFLIGTGFVTATFSVLVLYNYPQKYWIPWFLTIIGCAGTTTVGAWYFFTD